MNDVTAYFFLYASAFLAVVCRKAGTTFAFVYLLSWEAMNQALHWLGQYDGSMMPIFFGLMLDAIFIKAIDEYNLDSVIALPALLVSAIYGAATLVYAAAGGVTLVNWYGWVNAILAGIVVAGGFYNDPGNRRRHISRAWTRRVMAGVLSLCKVHREKTP